MMTIIFFSDWYMEYLKLRANYKSFSYKNSRSVLIISHFHGKDEKGVLICPRLHILYNKLGSKKDLFIHKDDYYVKCF